MRRYRYTGRRVAYHRPKTPAPKNGWLLSELAQLTELPGTTVRYYLLRRVIEPMEIRGTATRYGRHSLLRLLGVMRLKLEEDSTIEEKKRKLDAMDQVQLERWLCSGSLPHAAVVALGIEALPGAKLEQSNIAPALESSAATNSTTPARTQSANEPETRTVESLECIALMPGLDLIVRADAREPARLVARQIREVYAMRV